MQICDSSGQVRQQLADELYINSMLANANSLRRKHTGKVPQLRFLPGETAHKRAQTQKDNKYEPTYMTVLSPAHTEVKGRRKVPADDKLAG